MDLLIHRFAVSIRLPRAAPARPPAPGPWHGPGRRRAGRIVQLRKERLRELSSRPREFSGGRLFCISVAEMCYRTGIGILGTVIALICDVSALDLHLQNHLDRFPDTRDRFTNPVAIRRPTILRKSSIGIYSRPGTVLCSLIGPGTFISGLHAGKLMSFDFVPQCLRLRKNE
jgi:hypothetical protein